MAFSTGELRAAEHVLVRIHSDAGIVGVAEAPARPMTYGESQASIAAAIERWIAPALVGQDPFAVERHAAATAWLVANNTAKGAVDIALWDIVGQVLGVPCHRLMGGYAEKVRVTHMLGFGEPAALAEEALEMTKQHGITAFKLKVGVDLAVDVAACRAVRLAVGPEALLYLDANHGYGPEEAISACRAMAEYGVAWIEEPTPASDFLGRQRLVSRLDIPVLGDESCATLPDVAREVSNGAAQMISIKPARTGFTVSKRILGLCVGLGARVLCGNQLDGQVGTAATVAFAAAHEATASMPAELSHYVIQESDLLAEPLRIVDGHIAARDRPGLGLVIDESALAHFRVEL